MPGSFRFTTTLQKSVHQTLKLINMRARGLVFTPSSPGPSQPLRAATVSAGWRLSRLMAPREGTWLGNDSFKKPASVLRPLAQAGERDLKGHRTPSLAAYTGQRAAPDLLRQSASSACLARAACTTASAIAGALSTKRAAPATTTLEPSSRAHPALSSQRSGPRQRPSGGDPRDPFRRKRGTRP